MRATQHRSNNDVLRAPPGVSIEDCAPLPITRIQYATGEHAVISYWVPTAAELARLNAGKPVAIVASGRTHPPIFIGVDGDEHLPEGAA